MKVHNILLFFLLLGCMQQPDPVPNQYNLSEPQENTPTESNITSPEVIPSIDENPIQQFDPKSSGSPNPRNVQSHPEKCCNHPYYHYVVSASSVDGLSWQEDNIIVREHSSVPDFAILEDGTMMLYFVDGVYDTLGCLESNDGKTFTDYDCRVYNFTKEKIWDPNVVDIGNGTYRMFFFSPELQPNTPGQPKNRIFSAISKNGKDWLMEPGIRYEYVSITDPSIIQRKDGIWFMFVSHGNTIIQAESSDGLSFRKLQEITTIGGVPDVVEINGKYFLFTCSNGISYATSYDLVSWSGLTSAIGPWNGGVICDPTVEKANSGYKMYLKRMGK